MPTARNHTSVVSLQSALVVVGGEDSDRHHTHAVELFKADISQWYRTDPLPTACRNISLTIIGTTCYALGGYNGSCLNQALMSQLMIFFATLCQRTRQPTVEEGILSQLGRI